MDTFHLTLTPSQAAYLQNYLPHRFSFQTATLESKRPRAIKKMDQSFTSAFTLLPLRKTPVSSKNKEHTASKRAIHNEQVSNRQVEAQSQNQIKTSQKQFNRQSELAKKKSETELHTLIEKLLRVLKNCKYSWPFLNAADSMAQEASYSEAVKEPIDLKIVQKKFRAEEYSTFDEFDADIKRIIQNSYRFNEPDTNHYAVTIEFQSLYLDAVKQHLKRSDNKLKSTSKSKGEEQNVEKQLFVSDPLQKSSKVKAKESKTEKKNGQSAVSQQKAQSTESSLSLMQQKSPMKEMNFREREKVFNKIDKLSQENLRSFIKLCGIKTSDEWSQVEIQLADLSEETFKKIEVFLQEH